MDAEMEFSCEVWVYLAIYEAWKSVWTFSGGMGEAFLDLGQCMTGYCIPSQYIRFMDKHAEDWSEHTSHIE